MNPDHWFAAWTVLAIVLALLLMWGGWNLWTGRWWQ